MLAPSRLVSLQTASYGTLVQTMRESWTDERLDDLKERIDERFDQVDLRFAQVEARVTEGLARVDADIRGLRRMMAQGFIALVGIMVTGFLSLAGLMVL